MWDIVWVSPQVHRSVSVSRHFLLQAPQCPCSVWKRFRRDHCCRGRSKPGCRIVGSHTRWEWTTRADFQLCLHRLHLSITNTQHSFKKYKDGLISEQRWDTSSLRLLHMSTDYTQHNFTKYSDTQRQQYRDTSSTACHILALYFLNAHHHHHHHIRFWYLRCCRVLATQLHTMKMCRNTHRWP